MTKPAILTFASALALTLPLAASADEVWDTGYGRVVYDSEIGDVAVFRYVAGDGESTGRVFVHGLAGVFEERGSYEGYWVEYTGQQQCPMGIVDANGGQSHAWGRFEMTFVSPDFPSDWTAKWGNCLEDPDLDWIGLAVTGEDARQ